MGGDRDWGPNPGPLAHYGDTPRGQRVVVGQGEEPSRVLGRDPGKFVPGETEDLGETPGGERDATGLVGPAAEGVGAEVGAVGLDEEPVEGDAGGRRRGAGRGPCS